VLLALVAVTCIGAAVESQTAGSASAVTSFTVSLGVHGGARWTVGTSVYVNLKALRSGTWKQELWSGTCASPGERLVVLPGLVVTSSRNLAKTTRFANDLPRDDGVVIRLLSNGRVVCAAFVRSASASPSASPSTSPAQMATLRGMNVVGMEMDWFAFDEASGPVANVDYPVISDGVIDYLASKHVGVIRLLFSWEGMQSTLDGPIPAATSGPYRTYADTYRHLVDYATGLGLTVIAEPWQSNDAGAVGGAMWRGHLVGSSAVPIGAFADFWSKMAGLFVANPRVQFGLVNEPNSMSTTAWWHAAQAAVTAIRASGARQRILVPGNGYSAASTWPESSYDTDAVRHSNAWGWLNAAGPGHPLADPLHNTIAEVHTYLDADQGGRTTEITSVTAAREHLTPAVDEARRQGYRAFLGEIGFFAGRMTDDGRPASAAWADFVAYANANTDTLAGWAWWAAGQPGSWDNVGGGSFSATPTDAATFTGDTVNMTMIENDF
jgi:endoglucanase